MSLDLDRFVPGSGKARPPYQPKTIDCPNCGSSFSLGAESTRFAVCEYCSSQIQLTDEAALVVGQLPANKPPMDLELGASVTLRKVRYEVAARLVTREVGTSDLTKQYFLYHPRRASKWLSEYQRHWDISERCHVSPEVSPFNIDRGGVFATHDGKKWVSDGHCVYDVIWVDGALPFAAAVGSRIEMVEAAAIDGSGETFEVELSGNEIEHAQGRRLSYDDVRHATGKRDLPPPPGELDDPALVRKHHHRLMIGATIALAINLIGLLGTLSAGEEIYRQSFSAEELTAGASTEPFEVGAGDTLGIRTRSNLDNAWLWLSAQLVRDDDDALAAYVEREISYYHGTEGGEGWSEGSRKNSKVLLIPEAGMYRMEIEAVSGHGESNDSDRSNHSLDLRLVRGARSSGWFIFGSVFSVLILIISAAAWGNYKEDE